MFYYSLLQSDLYITDKIYAKNLFFEMLRKVAAVVAFWGFSHYFHEHSYNYLKRITLENFSSCTYRVPFRFLRRCQTITYSKTYCITYFKISNKATMLEVKFSCIRHQKKFKKEEKDHSLGIKSKTFYSEYVREHQQCRQYININKL